MSEAQSTEQDLCWSRDECDFSHNTLGDLIDCSGGELQPGNVVYCATPVQADVSNYFDADDLLERLGEVAYDNHGEYAEDWPSPVSAEAKIEFNTFVSAWIEKNCPVTFYGVEDIKPYTITAEDLGDQE